MRIGKDVLKKLYIDDKLSCNEISERYNIPASTLRYWLNSLGIKRRSISEYLSIQWVNKRRSYSEEALKKKTYCANYARKFITKDSNKKQALSLSKKHKDRELVIRNAKRVRTKEWKIISNKIMKRDDYKCMICGKENCRLQVHHLDPYGGHDDSNLITICCSCHAKETWKFIKGFNNN